MWTHSNFTIKHSKLYQTIIEGNINNYVNKKEILSDDIKTSA